jgi:hypothetical protein
MERNGCKCTFNNFTLLEYCLRKNILLKYRLTPKISLKHHLTSKNLNKASKSLFEASFKTTKNLAYIEILI